MNDKYYIVFLVFIVFVRHAQTVVKHYTWSILQHYLVKVWADTEAVRIFWVQYWSSSRWGPRWDVHIKSCCFIYPSLKNLRLRNKIRMKNSFAFLQIPHNMQIYTNEFCLSFHGNLYACCRFYGTGQIFPNCFQQFIATSLLCFHVNDCGWIDF